MGKAEHTRNYIIERAAPIFNRHGYAGTTMSQLIRAIGMTKGAIYGNFRDKDEIALAAFDHNVDEVSKRISQVIRSRDNACDKLAVLAHFYLDSYPEMCRRGGCPILNAAVDSDDAHEPLKARVAHAIGEWVGTVTRIVESGIRRGEIRPDIEAGPFASLFVSLIEGGILLSKTTGDPGHLGRNIEHLLRVVDTELRT